MFECMQCMHGVLHETCAGEVKDDDVRRGGASDDDDVRRGASVWACRQKRLDRETASGGIPSGETVETVSGERRRLEGDSLERPWRQCLESDSVWTETVSGQRVGVWGESADRRGESASGESQLISVQSQRLNRKRQRRREAASGQGEATDNTEQNYN